MRVFGVLKNHQFFMIFRVFRENWRGGRGTPLQKPPKMFPETAASYDGKTSGIFFWVRLFPKMEKPQNRAVLCRENHDFLQFSGFCFPRGSFWNLFLKNRAVLCRGHFWGKILGISGYPKNHQFSPIFGSFFMILKSMKIMRFLSFCITGQFRKN